MKNILEGVEDWQFFVEGELKKSNEVNNKHLGGQQPRHGIKEEDDSDTHYEVSMEKIMQRFSNFNSIISSNSQDDDEDEDDKKEEGLGEINKDNDGTDLQFSHLEQISSHYNEGSNIVETNVTSRTEMEKDYMDQAFWIRPEHLGTDVDELMKDL